MHTHKTAESGNQEASPEARAVADELRLDAAFEALGPVEHELAACLSSLRNSDETGSSYHLRRVIAGVKAAALALNAKVVAGGEGGANG